MKFELRVRGTSCSKRRFGSWPKIQVGVGQHDARVLGVEAQNATQSIGPRVLLLQHVRRLRRTDEGQGRHVAVLRGPPAWCARAFFGAVGDATETPPSRR
jgi:hypothetical protein